MRDIFFTFHLVYGRRHDVMGMLDTEIAHRFLRLLGDLDFRQHAVADLPKHPDFVTAHHQRIITSSHEVSINGVEEKVIENQKGLSGTAPCSRTNLEMNIR